MTLPPPGYPLYPLANPKGIDLVCELCQRPAFLQCTLCKVTYYCSVDHQRADWISIHEKICSSVESLKKVVPFIKTEDERRNRKEEINKKLEKMIELTRTIGKKLLFQGKHEQAVPTALQCLKFTIEVYGLASVELVPAYLILSEASIGLNRLPQAEEYLAQAQWTVLKSPNCSKLIRSQLHRKLGLLYSAKDDAKAALEQLAHDIFYSSTEFGTDSVITSGGYYLMGEVLMRQNRMDIADDLFMRVCTIWMDYLKKILESLTFKRETPDGIGEVVAEITQTATQTLDEAQEAEALKILTSIYSIRKVQSDVKPSAMALSALVLSMLYFILRDKDRSVEFVNAAEAAVCGDGSNSTSANPLSCDIEYMKSVLARQ